MKKYLSILVVVLLIVTLTGCKKEKTKREKGSSTNQDKIVVTMQYDSKDYENDSEIKYDFIYNDNNKYIKIERDDSEKKNCDFSKEPTCKYNIKFIITGIEEGHSQVKFLKYFNKNGIIYKEMVYDIVVDKNLKLSETHYIGNDYEKVDISYSISPLNDEKCVFKIENDDSNIVKIETEKIISKKCDKGRKCEESTVFFAKPLKEGHKEIGVTSYCNGEVRGSYSLFYDINKDLKFKLY